MRFKLLDRIIKLEPGQRIVACKLLDPDTDYLKDHFPRFPVMPGVLMLEAMYQASAWLIRYTDNFEHSVVLLKEARNVKYYDFVAPGNELEVTAEITKQEGLVTTLKTQGMIGGKMAVNGRLVLEASTLGAQSPARSGSDPFLKQAMRHQFALLAAAGEAT